MIIGADPGTKGGIVALDGDYLAAWRIPTELRKVGRTERPRVDAPALLELTRDLAIMGPRFAVLERVNGFGGQSGSTGFVFGHATGLLRMAFLAAGITVVDVDPAVWKAGTRTPRASTYRERKKAAMARAGELFPAHRQLWKSDGLAEAALMAEYGRTAGRNY